MSKFLIGIWNIDQRQNTSSREVENVSARPMACITQELQYFAKLFSHTRYDKSRRKLPTVVDKWLDTTAFQLPCNSHGNSEAMRPNYHDASIKTTSTTKNSPKFAH